KGPLNICITVFGEVAPGRALRRSAARAGDDVWVSGTLGDARLALAGYRGELALPADALAAAGTRMHTPTPRVALGVMLAERSLAHAAIDISDGLVGDLNHILERSRVGATLNADALPAGPVLAAQPQALRRAFTAAGGDDYEICFTAAASRREAILAAAADCGTPVTRIGRIDDAAGLRWTDADGAPLSLELSSFDHFTQ
ncbi:MAG TPA: AIR synthase-related protein, partial [Pseudoduganella sp.]